MIIIIACAIGMVIPDNCGVLGLGACWQGNVF